MNVLSSETRFWSQRMLWVGMASGLFCLSAMAQSTITLSWNAVPGATGYRIYQGLASHSYTAATDAGNTTQRQFTGLVAGTIYFFVISAYNAAGVESDSSAEVASAPTNAPVQPPPVPPAVSLLAPVTGGNFAPDASITFSASVIRNGHSISKVQFFYDYPGSVDPLGGILLGETSVKPYTITSAIPGAGNYIISARAFYENGGVTDSRQQNNFAQILVTAPSAASTLTFAAASGALSGPFTLINGLISQTVLTSVTNGGEAIFTFTNGFPGNYVVSAQVLAPNGAANSFYVNMDAEPADPTMIWNVPISTTLTNQTISWQGVSDFVPKVFFLSGGTHRLIIRGREANAQLGAVRISAAPFQLRGLANKQVVVSGVAQVNHAYDLLATVDFKTWRVIAALTTDATGAFSYTDTAAAALPARYYRLRG